jgi:hypothetical protein
MEDPVGESGSLGAPERLVGLIQRRRTAHADIAEHVVVEPGDLAPRTLAADRLAEPREEPVQEKSPAALGGLAQDIGRVGTKKFEGHERHSFLFVYFIESGNASPRAMTRK